MSCHVFPDRVAQLAGHDLKQELCELVQQVVGMNFQEEARFGVQSHVLTPTSSEVPCILG